MSKVTGFAFDRNFISLNNQDASGQANNTEKRVPYDQI